MKLTSQADEVNLVWLISELRFWLMMSPSFYRQGAGDTFGASLAP